MLRQMSHWVIYPLAWLTLMVGGLLIGGLRDTAPAVSEVNQFQINSFDARYVARATTAGKVALDVTERITATFEPYTNHGIERRLDVRYGDQDIQISSINVKDAKGKRATFVKRTADDGDLIIRIGDPAKYVEGTVTWEISYTIGNAMVQGSDRQELYVDINGTGWLQSMDRVTARFEVEAPLAARLLGQEACYVGKAGSTTPCVVRRSDRTFTAEVTGLGPREGMTVAIGFQPNTVPVALRVARPSSWGWPGLAMLVGVGLLCLGLSLGMRAFRRRTAHRDRPIVTQFTPPERVPAVAAADLLNRNERGAAAQLAELVVNGDVKMTATGEAAEESGEERRRSLLSPDRRSDLREGLTIRLVDPEKLRNPRLRTLCEELFGNGRELTLERAAARADIAVATAARRELLASLDLRKPTWLAGWMLALGMVALILLGWIQVGSGLGGLTGWFLLAGLVGVMLLIAAVHYYPPYGGYTPRGRQVRDHLYGLQDFVLMAEADRIAWLQNAVDAPRLPSVAADPLPQTEAGTQAEPSQARIKLYEPLLPYAIIFGAEDTWLQLLGSLYQTLPASQDASARAPLFPADLPAWTALTHNDDHRFHNFHTDSTTADSSFWNDRPAFGEGWFATGAKNLIDAWSTSRDDDGGGWSGGSSSGSSWSSGSSSSSSSSGSSGGGYSGGGVGGGGGGGW